MIIIELVMVTILTAPLLYVVGHAAIDKWKANENEQAKKLRNESC